jgi:hypothetical protein
MSAAVAYAESSALLVAPPYFRRGQCVLLDLTARANNVDGWGGTVLADDGLTVYLDVIAYAVGDLWHAADGMPLTITIPWGSIHQAHIFMAEDER